MATFSIGVVSEGSLAAGTCVSLEHGGRRLLFDFGRHMDPAIGSLPLPGFEPELVLISHGHLGHGGGVFKALNAWPDTLVYAATPTIHILDLQRFYQPRIADHPDQSALIAAPNVREIPFQLPVTPFSDLTFRFVPCGHVTGAAVPLVNWDGYRIAYLGDWMTEDYGGNPGLDMRALTNCDLLIVQIQAPGVPQLSTGRSLEALLKLSVQQILVPVQSAGVAQEVLIAFLRERTEGWTLHIAPFAFDISQLVPALSALLSHGQLQISEEWVSLVPDEAWHDLYIGGPASLWEGTPTFHIAQRLLTHGHALIALTQDCIPSSPAYDLIQPHCEEVVKSLFRVESIQCRIEILSVRPRKATDEEIVRCVEQIQPKALVVFGNNRNRLQWPSLRTTSVPEGGTVNLQL